MTELVKMERGFASMFVPPDKLALYLANGWKEIERVTMTGSDSASSEAVPPKVESEPKPKRLRGRA